MTPTVDADQVLSVSRTTDPRESFSYTEAFSRHAGLLSDEEQSRLRSSRVAIVGAGGVGGVHAVTLARLGIGSFSLADFDTFELVNFNRQFGARIDTLGAPKVDVISREILSINPNAQLRVFRSGVTDASAGEFLEGCDLFIDGLDFFEIELRRRLFALCRERGIVALTGGPMGFGCAWLAFHPRGMSFDEYFDLHDDDDRMSQIISFAVGLSPALLHRPYIDLDKVDFRSRRGPSAGLACMLAAGIIAGESVKVLLDRGKVRYAPHYAQFDVYRNRLAQGKLWWGNRHPVQRIKRAWLKRALLPTANRGEP